MSRISLYTIGLFALTVILSVLVALFPAHASAQNMLKQREAAWSAWHKSTDALWVKWRSEKLPGPMRLGIQMDLERFPAGLVAAGVLPEGDDHAWTEGCSGFEEVLVHATHEIASPMGVEGWAEWRAVHRVMCGPIEDERGLLENTFKRLSSQLPAAHSGLSWPSLVLDELRAEDWDCMASQVPDALRQGLDRHEGLKWVARKCRLEPSLVFGDAQRCSECTAHPRQPRQPTIQTWASMGQH